jgi:hypothetical protein
MKIVYQNVIWLVLFAAYNYISLAQDPPIEFDIGECAAPEAPNDP